MPILWDDQNHATSSHPEKHVHVCADGCGSAWECGQRDGCPKQWICPNCEQERLDHYIELLSQQEPLTHSHKDN